VVCASIEEREIRTFNAFVCVVFAVPFLLVASVLKQQGLSSVLSLWLSVPFLLLYWVMLWQTGQYLPVEKGAQAEMPGDGAEESIFDFVRDAMDVGKSVSRLSVVGVTTAAVTGGLLALWG
jgi:hypothetical protein